MRILLIGASGFIGRHLLAALSAAGHEIIATFRRGTPVEWPGVRWQHLDLQHLIDHPHALPWPEHLDVIINASGALSTDADFLERLQFKAASRLFDLAQAHGTRVLQISALGAGEQPDVPFLASKSRANDDLLQRGLPAVVLRPSLVIGPGGASSGWLQRLSPWPLIPLLNNQARLQPVHVDDLCAAVLALLRNWPETSCVLPLVGPQVMTQGELIDQLRQAQGWSPARYLRLPCARLAAYGGDRFGWRALNSQTLRLAERDNLASPEPLAAACGYRAAPLHTRLTQWPNRDQTVALTFTPIALTVLLMIWLGTAWICLGPGFDWGLRIMAEFGVNGWLANLAVIGGALLDGVLGIGLLFTRWRRNALLAQIGLMAGYTLFISLWLPHYWSDPFMAVGKNFAALALSLWLLWQTPPSHKVGR